MFVIGARLRILSGELATAVAIGLVCAGSISTAYAETLSFTTDDPEIEMWFYPVSSANGTGSVRDRGSSFASYSYIDDDGQVQFYGGDGYDSTRRGSVLLATDTSETIPVGLDSNRYQINSLRVTVTLIGSMGALAYDNTPDDALQLTTAGGDDPGNPIELWGVGLGGAYTRFGFKGETGAEYFNSGDRRWPIAAGSFVGPYQVYAIDPNGNDVENSVFGGYSATTANNVTDQFTPSPFAIGKAYDSEGVELAPGTMLAGGTELTFDFNLGDAGVVSYLQQSLAAGQLGLFLSSLHQPLAHSGEIAYPDYYLDNNVAGPNPNGAGPTFAIEVTILDDLIAGDYDQSGVVDGGDFLTWQRQFGSLVSPAGAGADGDGSGRVDAGDLELWKLHFGEGAPPMVASSAAVPEPQGLALLLLALAAFGGRMAPRRRPRCHSSDSSPAPINYLQ